MSILGQRPSLQIGHGYQNHPLKKYASAFAEVATNILEESSVDIFNDPRRAFLIEGATESLKDFFIKESSAEAAIMTAEQQEEHYNEMEALFENDLEAVKEYASVGSNNPVIGMSFPIHKNILMNCIFDKGAIQKAVAVAPKFTFTMENRYLVTPSGEKIDLWKEQSKIKNAIDSSSPFVDVELTLPETGATDILSAMGASSLDNLSIDSYISAVQVEASFKTGDTLPDGTIASADTTQDIWLNVRLKFTPAYGEYDRQIMQEVVLPENAWVTQTLSGGQTNVIKSDIISGTMKNNIFQLNSLKGIIKKVKLAATKDTSNGLLQTCSVKWEAVTTVEEIGPAKPINTAISPDEVKDIGALYNVNQLTKVMDMFNDVLKNYKDDTIKDKLDDSFVRLNDEEKIKAQFDFMPRAGYALDHVEWRHKTFFDALDTHTTKLIQVLNDPNITVSIFGRPDLIRKITPTQYDFVTPQTVGPVDIDYVKTITTSDKRVYQFISSQKLNNSDELIIVLNPRNTDRVIYRIYDYQLYVSNEIRNSQLYTLPSIHAYERWKFVEYQPVQGRVKILNPTGLKED